MENWCVAYPALPGQTKYGAKQVPEEIRGRLDEYTKSRNAAGVTLERVFLMNTPKGDFFVLYGEGNRPFAATVQTLIESSLPIDKDFIQWQLQLTGIELAKVATSAPVRVLDYVAPNATRGRGLAFVAPIPAAKLAELRTCYVEATSRMEELREARMALGITRSQAFITETPMGAFLTVYTEAADPVVANEKFASSTNGFDVWLKSTVGRIVGIDFNQPLPAIEQVFEYPESV